MGATNRTKWYSSTIGTVVEKGGLRGFLVFEGSFL
jgi:hypothetical protein